MKAVGRYLYFLQSIVTRREAYRTYVRRTFGECVEIGVSSLFIIVLVSTFMGAVTAVQLVYNLRQSPFLPESMVGLSLRAMVISELAPSVIGIIFAGKVGSSIASQLGTMRITEQIDALEVMGINAASYLVLPKILGTLLMYPLLVIISAALSMYGGYFACTHFNNIDPHAFVEGMRLNFDPYLVQVAMCKAIIFSFLVSSIAAYRGFFMRGGALEIGKASTEAVTSSCIAVLIADYLVAEIML